MAESTIKVHVSPGIYRLGLSLMYLTDAKRIKNRRTALYEAKDKEHKVVHTVVDVMDCLLNRHLPLRKYVSRNIDILKGILREKPNHLNTMADLVDLHRKTNQEREAEKLDEKIEEILFSSNNDHVMQKAICMLEQGYALLFEDATYYKGDTLADLKRVSSICDAEYRQTIGHIDRERIQTVSNKMHDVILDLSFNPDACAKHQRRRKKEHAYLLLTMGINYLNGLDSSTVNLEENCIWTFYLATTRNANEIELQTVPMQHSDRYMEALKLFWKVTRLPDEFKFYRARSYANIGHLLTTVSMSFNNEIANENEDFAMFIKEAITNPLSSFDRALAIYSNDRDILNRYGKCMWILSKRIETAAQKRELLLKAEESLTKSTTENEYRSIFAHSVLVNVHLSLYELALTNALKQKHLLGARRHGVIMLECNFTGLNGNQLAQVCQKLAKSPDYKKYGQKYVKEPEYLDEALDHLNRNLEGYEQDYFTSHTFGSIYYDLGQYRQSAEWMKRAVLLSDPSRNQKILLQETALYVIKAIGSSEKFDEFITLLSIVPWEPSLIDIIHETCSFLHTDFGIKQSLLRYISEKDFMLKDVKVAKALQQVLSREDSVKVADETTLEVVDYTVLYNRDGTSSWGNPEFDFVAINGKTDASWIECFVLHQLRIQMSDRDICFRGYRDMVDFDSNSSIVECTMEGMKRSRRFIMFLSEEFLNREWIVLKSHVLSALHQIEPTIIIFLDGICAPPSELQGVRSFYMTNPKNIPSEVDRLKFELRRIL